jgi:hypothetical protein
MDIHDGGNKMHDDKMFLDCERCNGTGKEKYEPELEKSGTVGYRKCSACQGTGMIEISWHEYEKLKEREKRKDDN